MPMDTYILFFVTEYKNTLAKKVGHYGMLFYVREYNTLAKKVGEGNK